MSVIWSATKYDLMLKVFLQMYCLSSVRQSCIFIGPFTVVTKQGLAYTLDFTAQSAHTFRVLCWHNQAISRSKPRGRGGAHTAGCNNRMTTSNCPPLEAAAVPAPAVASVLLLTCSKFKIKSHGDVSPGEVTQRVLEPINYSCCWMGKETYSYMWRSFYGSVVAMVNTST